MTPYLIRCAKPLVITRPQGDIENEPMNSPDPASLQNLNDIALPESVAWWPLAGGWYFIIGMVLIILTWSVYRWIKRWTNNRYRRTALNHLRVLTKDIHDPDKRASGLRQLPILLKRTALSVYPRRQLASLTGKDWHDFLNSKVSTPSFDSTASALLDEVSYTIGDLDSVDNQASDALLEACKDWLKHHQPGMST